MDAEVNDYDSDYCVYGSSVPNPWTHPMTGIVARPMRATPKIGFHQTNQNSLVRKPGPPTTLQRILGPDEEPRRVIQMTS